jgi:hypothetical protein
MTLSKPTLTRIQLGAVTLDEAIEAGDVKVDGRKEAIGEFFGCSTPSTSGSHRHAIAGIAVRPGSQLFKALACQAR